MESLPLFSPPLATVNPSPRRGPGRPPKLNNPSPQPTSDAQQVRPDRPTRKRGRPAKLEQSPAPVADSEKRQRGRPPKQHTSVVPFASEPGSVAERPRGRPRKVVGSVGKVVSGKRRGRPPKGISPRKPRRISGKPLGRPKKGATSSKNPTFENGQGALNEELANKLELIQLKVREAVEIIRPYVTNEYAAIMALHQLEELMTTTITGPHSPPPPVNFAVSQSLTQPATMPERLTQPATVPEPGLGLGPGYARPFFGVPGPFSVNLPALNVTGPLHVPSQQTMNWFPSQS